MRSDNESEQLVTVLKTGDKTAIALATSLLDGSGIKYVVKNDMLQDLFTWGRLGIGFNPLMGPVRIMVDSSDVDAATELIGDITSSRPKLPFFLRILAIIALLSFAIGMITMIINGIGNLIP